MTPARHWVRQNKSVLAPILMTCLGYGFYNLSDAATKQLLEVSKLYFAQVMLTSAALMIVFMAIYGWFKDGKKAFRTNKPKLLLLRATLAQVTTLCNLLAFPHLHLTVFYTLVFTSPFWVALLSIVLGDKADKRRIGIILFGFAVVLFTFRPGSGLFSFWSALILLSAFFYSCQLLVIRRIGSGESRALMVIYGCVMSMLIAIPFLGDHYVPLTLHEGVIFTGLCFCASMGILCITYAYQSTSSPAAIAPCHYTQIIWGSLLGYYIFNEVPGMQIMIGAVLLIGAGIYLVRHETRRTILKPGV